MVTARRTFVGFSSASDSFRSANTLPGPRVTGTLVVLCITHLIVLLRSAQPESNQVHVSARRRDAVSRFLLKCVQHVNCLRKPDGKHGPIGVAAMVLNDLQYPGSLPFHGFAARFSSMDYHGIRSHRDHPLV